MATVRYGSERRYLVKVLREVARRIERIAASLDEPALAWRADEGEPSAFDLLTYLREAEREDLRAVSGVLATDRARLEERRATLGATVGAPPGASDIGGTGHSKPEAVDPRFAHPGAADGGAGEQGADAAAASLLWDFAVLRDELVWQLETAGEAWSHAGRHAYRGVVPLPDLVREIGDRDLEVMWRLQQIAAQAPGARRRAPQRRRARRLGQRSAEP